MYMPYLMERRRLGGGFSCLTNRERRPRRPSFAAGAAALHWKPRTRKAPARRRRLAGEDTRAPTLSPLLGRDAEVSAPFVVRAVVQRWIEAEVAQDKVRHRCFDASPAIHDDR